MAQVARSSVVLNATLDLIYDMCDPKCQGKWIDITQPCYEPEKHPGAGPMHSYTHVGDMKFGLHVSHKLLE